MRFERYGGDFDFASHAPVSSKTCRAGIDESTTASGAFSTCYFMTSTQKLLTSETGRPRIQRQVRTVDFNVSANNFDHVSFFGTAKS